MSGRGRGRGGRGRRQWNNNRGGGRRHHGRGGGRGGRRHYTTPSGPDTTKIEEFGVDPSSNPQCVSIAIEGCCHGALDAIYDRLQAHVTKTGRKVDLLICCGDFQSLRSTADFHSFAVPPKYHELGSFHKYYTGEKVAPITTLFIGGNHEASQPLQELYYGGWAAPNIYYLGASGVVNFRGVRIGGISGIFKGYDFGRSRFERPPYDKSTMRSVYHYRNVEAYRLSCLQPGKLHLMLSHDWPQGIEQYGDTQGLIRRKPFFREEIARNELGSPPLMSLLQRLQPKYWFSAHLHVKFNARVTHGAEGTKKNAPAMIVPTQVIKSNPGETTDATHFIAPEATKCTQTKDLTDLMTQFLSLDKCLPRRHYLSIVHVPSTTEEAALCYDPEWLSILRSTHGLSYSNGTCRVSVPNKPEHAAGLSEIAWVEEQLGNDCKIPENFAPNVVVAPGAPSRLPPLPWMGNPQTDRLLQILQLEHLPNLTAPYTRPYEIAGSIAPAALIDKNEIDLEDENEIDLDDDEDNVDDISQPENGASLSPGSVPDPKRAKVGGPSNQNS